jgi:hypothetical protein
MMILILRCMKRHAWNWEHNLYISLMLMPLDTSDVVDAAFHISDEHRVPFWMNGIHWLC